MRVENVGSEGVEHGVQGGLLLDCGEGTYGQLVRRYGGATGAVLAGLRLIWISHIHADHHAGLARCYT